jgi:glycosyltransferase involved in cell wall biosynthesis
MYDALGTWIEADLRAAGITLHFLGKKPGLEPRIVLRLARALTNSRPEVVHTHMYALKYALAAELVARKRCPIVHTLHNLAQYEADWPSRIVQYAAFQAGVVPVAIGEAVAASVRHVYHLSPRYTIPNGIPVSDYAPPMGARGEVRASLQIPDAAPVFVTVGRFDPQKNHASLIGAFSSDGLRSIGAHLMLVGDGRLRPELERQAIGLSVRERVHFLGVRRDVPRVLAAADVFVLSSRFEGNPLTVMEAMAAGKPVVATAVGCVPELVADDTGRLVPPGDDRALEAAMLEFARSAPLAVAKGSAAMQVARDRFDAFAMGQAYERVYADVA